MTPKWVLRARQKMGREWRTPTPVAVPGEVIAVLKSTLVNAYIPEPSGLWALFDVIGGKNPLPHEHYAQIVRDDNGRIWSCNAYYRPPIGSLMRPYERSNWVLIEDNT